MPDSDAIVVAFGPVDESAVADILGAHARLVNDPTEEDIHKAVGAIVRAHTVVDAKLLDRMPHLQVIARTGVGTERVDVAEANRRGIPVVITPGSNTNAVAEGAMAHLLSLTKSLAPLTTLVREDRWTERDSVPVGDLEGGTLAILGYGRIGSQVARLATAFGMTVVAFDPYVTSADVPLAANAKEAVAHATHISIHLPATPSTRHLVSRDLIHSMKDGVIVVNLARGEVVDLDALYEALESGKIGGVGLDVFDVEPPEHHPIFDHPKVVLSPHVMGLTAKSTRETFRQAARGVADVLAGKQPKHVASPPSP